VFDTLVAQIKGTLQLTQHFLSDVNKTVWATSQLSFASHHQVMHQQKHYKNYNYIF
jgi:hypothetical protein